MKIKSALLISLLAIASCGGGGAPAPSDTGGNVAINLTPGTASIAASQTQTFSATVTGSSNVAVTWSIQEGSAGGAISQTGIYTAPNASGTFHVIATSQADPSKSLTATITCNPVNPSISSTAPVTAAEATTYSYVLAATDPAGGTVTYTLTSAPTGATLNGASITWTPTAIQARVANAFTITAKTQSNGTATQSWSVTPTGTIRGTAIDTYYTTQAQAVLPYPEDLSNVTIAALVPDSSGGYTTYPGTGTSSGAFQIPNVPAGSFYVEELAPSGAVVMTSLFETSGGNIDLGINKLGRLDAVPSSPGTTLTFNVTNANTIQTIDEIQYFVPSVGGFTFLAPFIPSTTTLTTPNVRWSDRIQTSAKGDTGYLTQLGTQFFNGQAFQILKKTLQTSIDMNNGGNTVVSGTFMDVPQTASIDVNVKGSSFAFYDSAMSPIASAYFGTFLLSSNPGGTSAFLNLGPPNLVANVTLHSVDTDFGNIAYGNPYPSSFITYISFTERAQGSFTAPGATIPVTFDAAMVTSAPSDALQPLLPVISPATNPTINGSSLFAPQTGVGFVPTISWNSPQLGTSDVYSIRIYSLLKLSSGATVNVQIGFISTSKTSVRIPPGVLSAGGSYFVVIRATSQPGRNANAPIRVTKPENYAELISAAFQP